VAEPEVVLGIDLVFRGHVVRKLLFAGFGARMARYHYDPEDVLQEVYRGLLARNIGTCPWDIRKSSFGHYVHMVCSCVLNNYARKLRRRGEFEQLGLGALDRDGNWGQVDAAEVAVSDPCSATLEEPTARSMALNSLGAVLRDLDRPEAKLAVKVLPMVAEGYQRGEIAKRLRIEPAKVGKALSLIRATTREWAMEQGLR
jgi:DNA-directed RNA polymerase specialized sigma24 family protein